MSLSILGQSVCSICGKLLNHGQDLIGWQHFLPREDHLWRFSDSTMHKECFEAWDHRDEFLRKHQIATGEIRVEPEPLKTNIIVLGFPEDRADLIGQLRNDS